MSDQYHFIGNDALESLKKVLDGLAPSGIFLVHGHKSYSDCGAAEAMDSLLKGYEVTEFDAFSSNPKYEEAEAGCEAFIASGADVVIGVGGGSGMDIAKAIRHLAAARFEAVTGS